MSFSINKEHTAETVSDIIRSKFSGGGAPLLIAVGGPGGTGKSIFSRELAEHLGGAKILRLDDYKTHRRDRKEKGLFGPHPEANEMDVLVRHFEDIKANRKIFKPVYDRELGFAEMTEIYAPVRYNILDGEVATYKKFRSMIDFSVYIDADLQVQLKTRLTRDVEDRGYTLEKAIATFGGSNVGEFLKYGAESRKWADIILHCKEDYEIEIPTA